VDPAGELLAVGYPDGTVELRDLTTGTPLRRGRAHDRDLARLTFSASGRWLATASRAGKLRVFEVASGAGRLGHEGHTGWVTSVSWHRGGARLATGSLDGSVRVWEATTGRLLERLVAGSQASCVRYSPDGRWLAWAGKGGDAWVRPSAGGAPRRLGVDGARRSASPYAVPQSLAFSPDGRLLVVAGRDWSLRVWDPATGAQLASYAGHGAAVQTIAFAPDGQGVVSADEGGELHRWDPRTGAPESRWPAHQGLIRGLVALPRGRTWSAGHDGLLRLWRGPREQREVRVPGVTQIGGLALSPDGRWLAVLDTRGPAVLVDAVRGARVAAVADRERAFEAAFSPDGTTLATADLPGTATLWDVETTRARGR